MQDNSIYSKNILRLQLIYGINGFTMFFGVIYVLFLQKYLDNFIQISLLLSIAIGLYILFEYLTGIIADKYGRIKSIQIGHFFAIIAMIIFLYSSSFFGFLLALICLVLSGSFNSGSIEASFYESLKKLKREKEYDSILSKAQVLIVSTGIITNFLAPLIFDMNPKYPFVVSLIFAIIGFILSLSLFETLFKTKNKCGSLSFKEIFSKSSKVLFSNLFLFSVLLYSVLFGSIIASFGDLFNQPLIFDQFGIEFYGVIFALATVIQTIIIYFTPKIISVFRQYLYLLLVIIWTISLTIVILQLSIILTIFCLGVMWSVGSIRYIFISKAINDNLEEDGIRASTHSFMNLIQSGVIALVILIGGILIDFFSMKQSLIILSLVLIPLSLLFGVYLFFKKKINQNSNS